MSTAAREEAERRWPVHVEGEDKPLPTETRRLQREAFIAGWEARDAQVAELVSEAVSLIEQWAKWEAYGGGKVGDLDDWEPLVSKLRALSDPGEGIDG